MNSLVAIIITGWFNSLHLIHLDSDLLRFGAQERVRNLEKLR